MDYSTTDKARVVELEKENKRLQRLQPDLEAAQEKIALYDHVIKQCCTACAYGDYEKKYKCCLQTKCKLRTISPFVVPKIDSKATG